MYSKRQNKNHLKALLKEADELQRRWNKSKFLTYSCLLLNMCIFASPLVKTNFSQVMCDLPVIKQKFDAIEEGRKIIVAT